MITLNSKRIIILLIVTILCLSSCIFLSSPIYAESNHNNFDDTNVLDDLHSIDNFNILNYPFDSTGAVGHPEIFNVVEYCYSFRANMQGNYGIYLYVYNPQCLNIDTGSIANKVQIAVSYKQDKDGFDIPIEYDKFSLQFCSTIESGNYKNLFYKFKVIDQIGNDGKTILQRVNSSSRRYDISGIELHTYGLVNATEYTVGGTYIFTGYAKGYGADLSAESNLSCTVDNLQTIKLDLSGVTDGVDKRTYWRSNSSSLGKNHQNQINSVFFAIDNNLLAKFDYILQRIKAEWWEYKTRPVIVMDNKSVYNNLLPKVGQKISEDYDTYRGYTIDYIRSWIGGNTGSVTNFGWSYNAQLGTGIANYFSDDIETLLPLLFYTGDGIKAQDYTLTADILKDYFTKYNSSYDKGHLMFNSHDYSADLFCDNVDNGRVIGKNTHTFDLSNSNDYYDLKSYDSTHSWWNKFWDYGFGSITTNDDFANVAPIYMVKPEDMIVSDLSTHLKINPSDVSRFKDYYNSVNQDNTVFLFRYATTDYFATDLNVYDIANNVSYNASNNPQYNNSIAELRQGTQFFDFDILEMTFNKDGVYTVIPVVCSPIDHWSDYTPSIDPKPIDWWKIVLGVILLIVLLLIIAPLLPLIIRLVIWIVCLPFRIIALPFKAISNANKKNKK